MGKAKTTTVHPTCDACAGVDFEIRVLKDEGIASAHCAKFSRDYLLLDSEDYWFDVIQAGYPRPSRCTCKAMSFKLRCDYFYRENGDISSINVWSACSNCQKVKRQLTVDIDYGDTEELFTR